MYPLEHAPQAAQRQRLEAWLRDLEAVCRQHGFEIIEFDDGVAVLDRQTQTVVGLGVSVIRYPDTGEIASFDLSDSILDGAWLEP